MGGALQHWDMERVSCSCELHVGLTCAFELGSEKKEGKKERKRHASFKVNHSHVCWDVSWWRSVVHVHEGVLCHVCLVVCVCVVSSFFTDHISSMWVWGRACSLANSWASSSECQVAYRIDFFLETGGDDVGPVDRAQINYVLQSKHSECNVLTAIHCSCQKSRHR